MSGQKSRMDTSISSRQFEEMLLERIEPNFGRHYGEIVAANQLWRVALELGLHSDHKVAFRASYALEYAYFKNKEQFTPYIPLFLGNYITALNRSAHRHYSKILFDLVINKRAAIDDKMLERLAERAFDLLIDPNSRVAVKVWSMDLLFQFSAQLEWINEHLSEAVERQMELSPTPAMINHSRKLLKRICVAKIKG